VKLEIASKGITVSMSAALWLRFPLVPWTVSESMPVVALPGTMKDTCADAPVLIDRGQDGEQVTPEGSPVMLTDTDDEKPLEPTIEIVTELLVVPAWALRDEGETVMEKSGAVVTVRLSGAEWFKLPLIPWTVSEAVPVGAFPGRTNETCAEALALIERLQDGEQVVPDVNPLMVTDTDPEKPFEPVMETVTGALVVPAWVLTDEGETEIEKSGEGGGVLVADPPLPHPINRPAATSSKTTRTHPKWQIRGSMTLTMAQLLRIVTQQIGRSDSSYDRQQEILSVAVRGAQTA
jgi:hypothetical protein